MSTFGSEPSTKAQPTKPHVPVKDEVKIPLTASIDMPVLESVRPPAPRIPLPAPYDGSISPSLWLMQMEHMAQYSRMDETSVLMFITTLLRGSALIWMQSLLRRHNNKLSYALFKGEFLKYFEPINPVKKARDRLANLKQSTSLNSYVQQFRELANQATDMSEAEQLDRFVRGLKTRTRIEVELRDPKTLDDAIVMSDRFDSVLFGQSEFQMRDQFNNRNRFAQRRSQPAVRTVPSWSAGSGVSAPSNASATMELDSIKFKKLTPEERDRLRKMGSCFYCRQPGHMAGQCPKKPKETYAITKSENEQDQ